MPVLSADRLTVWPTGRQCRKEEQMKCIILAAGYATRLYPLTENFPKPLLKVGDKAILDWLIDDIETAVDNDGRKMVDGYTVVTNHRFAQHFSSWADERKETVTVLDDGTLTNETRLGAVKDIQFALEETQTDDDVLVIAGDNVLDFSLSSFTDYYRKKKTSCIMRYREKDTARLRKCGVVCTDESDLVLNMEEKPAEPKSEWCCPPFYIYTKEDARLVRTGIESGCGTDAPGSYIAWLCGQTKVHAMEMPGKRYDIGNLESYNNVCASYHGICR